MARRQYWPSLTTGAPQGCPPSKQRSDNSRCHLIKHSPLLRCLECPRPRSRGGGVDVGGTYEDPTTGGPLTGDALAESVGTLITGFPDVHFEVAIDCLDETRAAAQWVMKGTNTRPNACRPRHQPSCGASRRRLHRLRPRGGSASQGARLFRHRHDAQATRASSPHNPAGYPAHYPIRDRRTSRHPTQGGPRGPEP